MDYMCKVIYIENQYKYRKQLIIHNNTTTDYPVLVLFKTNTL